MNSFYGLYLKRVADIFIAILLLIPAIPLMLITSLILYITGHKPVLFRQQRAGLNGRPFLLFKFRTMTNETNEKGELLSDESRMTTAGSFIRRTSLDELPQLWNVLKGEMSLIGPRPLIIEYLSLYDDEQKKRHLVKPGISGWAQVNGRNAISWTEKFNFDLFYVNNISFLLDLRIIFLTVTHILKAKGISQEGKATVESFNGKN
jgi:lipopolysaccharide/colanic/teichoic acid biosynthesis glycosyltransferase